MGSYKNICGKPKEWMIGRGFSHKKPGGDYLSWCYGQPASFVGIWRDDSKTNYFMQYQCTNPNTNVKKTQNVIVKQCKNWISFY